MTSKIIISPHVYQLLPDAIFKLKIHLDARGRDAHTPPAAPALSASICHLSIMSVNDTDSAISIAIFRLSVRRIQLALAVQSDPSQLLAVTGYIY